MKIKIVVVDLELSRRAKHAGAAVAVALLAVGAGAVAYASVPKTWADGETLTAADLNANFAALNALAQQVVPPGAIMAFDLAACPIGWVAFDAAAGRTLVGSSAALARGAAVGVDLITLSVAQMPVHSHAASQPPHNHKPVDAGNFITAGGVNNAQIALGAGFNFTGFTSDAQPPIAVANTGGSQPFDNRQASLVVTYCLKI
jgi:microcystin-dependent protein